MQCCQVIPGYVGLALQVFSSERHNERHRIYPQLGPEISWKTNVQQLPYWWTLHCQDWRPGLDHYATFHHFVSCSINRTTISDTSPSFPCFTVARTRALANTNALQRDGQGRHLQFRHSAAANHSTGWTVWTTWHRSSRCCWYVEKFTLASVEL